MQTYHPIHMAFGWRGELLAYLPPLREAGSAVTPPATGV